MRVGRADEGEVNVGVVHGAEFARGRGGGVGEVAAVGVDVRGHVVEAGCVGWGLEFDVFDGGALDVGVGEAGGEHAVDEVGEGGDAVHEDPEAW